MLIRPLNPADLPTLAAAFAAVCWPGKQPQLFQRYIAEQDRGERVVLVAEPDGVFAGYACIVRRSGYEPFRQAGIPEIADFNVLPAHRRRGVGTALMDAGRPGIAAVPAARVPARRAGHRLWRPDGRRRRLDPPRRLRDADVHQARGVAHPAALP